MVLELTILLIEEIEENNENNEELMNIRGLLRMIQFKTITIMTKELFLIALNEIHFRIG